MEDQFAKFLRLFGNIFFSAILFIIGVGLLLLGLRFILGALDTLPWFSYVYMTGMLLIPSAFFISVYAVYFKRTAHHPSKPVRLFSNAYFILAILSWVVVLITDSITFIKKGRADIDQYYSFNLLYLVINIGMIFFIGIIQALTSVKEEDWMKKYQ